MSPWVNFDSGPGSKLPHEEHHFFNTINPKAERDWSYCKIAIIDKIKKAYCTNHGQSAILPAQPC